ncbi:MAG: hypothetical protein ACD_21C00263G0002 [uncultured bacterium]|nr:MAG: hypothetical protein ACD_21C00263G0002 [uncultured bacterium]
MKTMFFLALILISETASCGQIYKNRNIAIYKDYHVLTFEVFAPEANLLRSAFIKKPYEFCSSDGSFKVDCISSSCKVKLPLTANENFDVKVPFVKQTIPRATCKELIRKIEGGYYTFDENSLSLRFSDDGPCVLEYLNFGNYSNHKIDIIFKEFLEYKKSERGKIKKFPGNINDCSWVKNKLQVLVNIDQKARLLWYFSGYNKLKLIDKVYFDKAVQKKLLIDTEHTSELKELLKKYNWFVVSEFGKKADHNGWLLIQHQDHDREFQKMILKRLRKLCLVGETSKSNYAYLYDRIAIAENKPQKYGTQGRCIGKGLWEPALLGDAKQVDRFRKEVGLEPMSEYKKTFKDICPVI